MAAFEFAEEITVVREVKVRVPGDGRVFRDQTFKAHFKILPMDELADLLKSLDRLKFDDELMRRVFVGWGEGMVSSHDKNPIPYSDEMRDRLIQIPYVRTGLVKSYMEAAGMQEKNW